MISGEFTERMTSGCTDVREQSFLCQGPHRCTVREERRLCVTGRGELVRRAFEAKFAEIRAERGIDLAENSFGDWK